MMMFVQAGTSCSSSRRRERASEAKNLETRAARNKALQIGLLTQTTTVLRDHFLISGRILHVRLGQRPTPDGPGEAVAETEVPLRQRPHGDADAVRGADHRRMAGVSALTRVCTHFLLLSVRFLTCLSLGKVRGAGRLLRKRDQ